MTDRPPVAKLCRACMARFHPLDQPRCSACDPAQCSTGPRRPKPEPPTGTPGVPFGKAKPPAVGVFQPLDLAALPTPDEADLAAYLAEATDQSAPSRSSATAGPTKNSANSSAPPVKPTAPPATSADQTAHPSTMTRHGSPAKRSKSTT